MKLAKKTVNYLSNKITKGMIFSMSLLLSSTVFAEEAKGGEDIVNTLIKGSIGKTLGSSGKLWALLTAIGFAASIFFAVTTSNPKAVIPGFIMAALISTVTAYFITF